jgi:hypothetical protein
VQFSVAKQWSPTNGRQLDMWSKIKENQHQMNASFRLSLAVIDKNALFQFCFLCFPKFDTEQCTCAVVIRKMKGSKRDGLSN